MEVVMNWFVSKDRTVALNLDKFFEVKSNEWKGEYEYIIVEFYGQGGIIKLSKEHYFELIEFIEQRSAVMISSDLVTQLHDPNC